MKHIVVLATRNAAASAPLPRRRPPLSPGDFIGHWMALMAPAAKIVGPRGERPLGDYLTALEQASAILTLDNLMTFPCVRILVERGKLKLHAAYFGVASGDLSIYEPESRTFVRVADAHAKMLAQPQVLVSPRPPSFSH